LRQPPATSHSPRLSLHDALPIYCLRLVLRYSGATNCTLPTNWPTCAASWAESLTTLTLSASTPTRARQKLPKRCENAPISSLQEDRKSTRLNSSHVKSSYAVFCL